MSGHNDMAYSWSKHPYQPVKRRTYHCCPSKTDNKLHYFVNCPVNVTAQPGGTLPDLEIRKEAVKFLKDWGQQSQPFFLAVGLHKPHLNLRCPEAYLSLHPMRDVKLAKYQSIPKNLPEIAFNPFHAIRHREDVRSFDIPEPWGIFPQTLQASIKRNYYSCVTYVDDQIGKILDALVLNGHADNTVINFVSDHGFSLGENGEFSKCGNFDVKTRVPWLLHDPESHPSMSEFEYQDPFKTKRASVKPHEAISNPVEMLDIFPTLVDVAGLPQLQKCINKREKICTEGCSRASNSNNAIPSSAVSQYPRPALHPARNSDVPGMKDIHFMGYTIKTEKYRYTEWVGYNTTTFKPDWDRIVALEMYDHQSDPEEHFNIAGDVQTTSVRNGLSFELRQRLRIED